MVATRLWPHMNITYREEIKQLRNMYRSANNEAKTEYYAGKIQECAADEW